ncbi:MAG TPA: hypothetical protein VLC09_03885 [Polyangiaceae bacterium]|nr:hypothetical protein [Polyangiaceae bacterium]
MTQVGPWVLEATLEDATAMQGRVLSQLGELELSGTIDPRSGTFGEQRTVRIVAGGGGWGKVIAPQGYANDAGVKAADVAQDAAKLAGEELGAFTPRMPQLGVKYTRKEGPASVALVAAAGGAPWWVDYDGLTHVGPRPALTPAKDSYEVLSHDTRAQVVTLAVDDLNAIGVGSVLTERLDAPQVVRELEIIVDGEQLRVRAWCGGDDATSGRTIGLLRRIFDRFMAERIHGSWIYRVFGMDGDRVNLQIVRKASGLPDVLRVQMMPGLAGSHSKLTPGSEVLVTFANGGDPSLPCITNFLGRGGEGFVPEELNICEGAAGAARTGDTVEVICPPFVFSGTVGGAPATGVMTAVTGKMIGAIKTGSGKVKIG